MIKLYIGGSPCTHWSIAQTKNRETEPSGLGWELFENYVIGLRKYKPNYFLYENNKSMSPAIREQITKELGVEPILINSSLVSAQNRQRLYWTNIPGITQPENKGILLKDILESGIAYKEKAYVLRASCGGGSPPHDLIKSKRDYAAEPIRIGTIESGTKTKHDSKPFRVYSPDGKTVTLQAEAGGQGAKTGLYAVPYDYTPRDGCEVVVSDSSIRCTNKNGKGTSQGYTVMYPNGKSATVAAGQASRLKVIEPSQNKNKAYPVYEVVGSQIAIKGKWYPIKLPDGYYIIRKLTVLECMRLQTVPEWYVFQVSNSQAYKMLGNGWTVDVIAHQLSFVPGITTEEIEVLSMYDGMSCGHIALDKLGANVIRYYATEIDKYAVQTTKHNYPVTIHLGDAYQVRNDDFILTSKDGKSYETGGCIGQMTIDDWLIPNNS